MAMMKRDCNLKNWANVFKLNTCVDEKIITKERSYFAFPLMESFSIFLGFYSSMYEKNMTYNT